MGETRIFDCTGPLKIFQDSFHAKVVYKTLLSLTETSLVQKELFLNKLFKKRAMSQVRLLKTT